MVFFCLHSLLCSLMLVTSELEKPTGVKIKIDASSVVANVSWKLPVNDQVNGTFVYLKEPENNRFIVSTYVEMPTSHYVINKQLTLCGEYVVELSFDYESFNLSYSVCHEFVLSEHIFSTDIGSSITMSWMTSLENFYQVTTPSGKELYRISPSGYFSKGISDNSKYEINETTKNISFTVKHVNQTDAGLYKTMSAKGDGKKSCALLIVSENLKAPHLSQNPKIAFVGDTITFTCNSSVQRWPDFIKSSLSYMYHGINGIRNGDDLVVKDLHHSFKGSKVTCTVTDIIGIKSGFSNAISVDPYYGPDTVVLDPYQDVINITEGDTLGPLDCTTDCYPPCNIIWKTNAKGDFTVFRKFLNIPNIMRNQTGTFTCKVSHTADTTRRKSKDVIVNVHYPSTISEIKLNNTEYLAVKAYSFPESKNLEISVKIMGSPESIVYFYKAGSHRHAIDYTRSGDTYRFYQNKLRCENSGKYIIEASNGIKYSSIKSIQLDILCIPRNVVFGKNVIGTMVGSFVNINVTMIANPKPSLKWGNYKGFKWEITHLKSYKYAGLSKIIISDRTSFRNYSMKVCSSVGCAVKNITVLDEDLCKCSLANSEMMSIVAGVLSAVVVTLLIPNGIFLYIFLNDRRTKPKIMASYVRDRKVSDTADNYKEEESLQGQANKEIICGYETPETLQNSKLNEELQDKSSQESDERIYFDIN